MTTPRFSPIEPSERDEDQARMAEKALPTGPFDVFMRAPRLWEALQEVRRYLTQSSQLPLDLREALMLAIARHWHCEAGLAAHRTLAARAGLSDTLIARLVEGEAPGADMPEAHRHALALAASLLSSGHAADALYLPCRDALGERACVEIVGLIGFFSTVCLTLNLGQVAP